MTGDCIIGGLYTTVDGMVGDLGHLSLITFGEYLSYLVIAWAAVGVAWHIIVVGIMRGADMYAVSDAVQYLVIAAFVILALGGGAYNQWYWPLFEGFADLGPWAASTFLGAVSGVEYSGTGISGLMCAIEQSLFSEFMKFAELMFIDIDIWSKMAVVLGSLLLTIPFLVLVWDLQKGILFAYMKIQAISILSPFLIMFLADKHTRPIFTHAIKLLVTSAFELFLASASVAMILYLASGLQGLFRAAPETGGFVMFSTDYWNLLFTAIMLIFAHKAMIGIAQQIMQAAGETASDAVQPARDAGQALGFVGGAATAATTGLAMTNAIAAGIKLAQKTSKSAPWR